MSEKERRRSRVIICGCWVRDVKESFEFHLLRQTHRHAQVHRSYKHTHAFRPTNCSMKYPHPSLHKLNWTLSRYFECHYWMSISLFRTTLETKRHNQYGSPISFLKQSQRKYTQTKYIVKASFGALQFWHSKGVDYIFVFGVILHVYGNYSQGIERTVVFWLIQKVVEGRLIPRIKFIINIFWDLARRVFHYLVVPR